MITLTLFFAAYNHIWLNQINEFDLGRQKIAEVTLRIDASGQMNLR